MTAVRVLKFGGDSLRDGGSIRRVVRIVREHGGARPIVVVSAHQGVTDLLERSSAAAVEGRVLWDEVRVRHRTLLRQLGLPGDLLYRHLRDLRAVLEELSSSPRRDRRFHDFILSFGERMSARIVAAALRSEGVPATPLDAFDLGLTSDERSGHDVSVARPSERARRALTGVPGIPVVTGFLAQDRAGHVTTLGRNGSDLSATWIAEAVGAKDVQLWKTVGGIRTADPRLVPEARPVPELGWDEAAELSAQGATVLHPGTTEPARRAGIPIRVLDVRDPTAPGTRVFGEPGPGRVRALAHRASVAVLRGRSRPDRGRGEQLAVLLRRLCDEGIDPLLGAISGTDVAIVVSGRDARSDLPRILPGGGDLERGLATIGLVGHGIGDERAFAERLPGSEGSARSRARPAPGGRSPHGRVFLVRAVELASTLRAAHAALFEGDSSRSDRRSREASAARPVEPGSIER